MAGKLKNHEKIAASPLILSVINLSLAENTSRRCVKMKESEQGKNDCVYNCGESRYIKYKHL
jgi:hypothetical protein